MSAAISHAGFQPGQIARAQRLYLSPSKVITYEMCPRQYWFQYVAKLEADAESSNLYFGTVLHQVVEEHLHALDRGVPLATDQRFKVLWDEVTKTNALKFGVKLSRDDLSLIGQTLAGSFPKAWAQSGLRVHKDRQGQLVTERSLDVDLGDGVILSTKLDILAVNSADRGVEIVDAKTPTTLCDETFAVAADQPTAYQIAVEAHGESLGVNQIKRVRFFEGKKAKKVADWHWDAAADRRDDSTVDEYVEKVLDIATDIRRLRFPKRSLHAFNSPCKMCSFVDACHSGDMAGLKKKTYRQQSNVVQLPTP